jgi:hypothetical protein
MTRAALVLAGLILGWVAFVLAAVAAFLIADAHVDRKYRRNPNQPPTPVLDEDTEEFSWLWESPTWLRLPGDGETA